MLMRKRDKLFRAAPYEVCHARWVLGKTLFLWSMPMLQCGFVEAYITEIGVKTSEATAYLTKTLFKPIESTEHLVSRACDL